MGVGVIWKIVTGKCTSDDLKPVVQVTELCTIDDKHRYAVALSDGLFEHFGYIANEICISKKLQKGSIVQLTKYVITNREIVVLDLIVLGRKCNRIGDPKLIPDNEIPLLERTTPTIPDEDQIHANSHHGEEPPTSKQKQDHVDSLLNEHIDDSHHVEEHPTSVQNPSTSTQKCSSQSPTQNKKRKLQSTDDAISGSGKDMSDVMKMMVEITNDVRVLYKKVETLDEDVTKMTRMMMEKNKEDDMGACIEKLDKIGWGTEEPIYDTALLLFLKGADYRKLWLHLKPERCGKWVKIAGSIFGLLD